MGLDLDLLLAVIQDAIIIIDSSLCIISWNAGAANLFGWDANDVLGRPFREVFQASADQENEQDFSNQVVSWLPGKIYETGWKLSTRSGNRLWIKVRGIELAEENRSRKILLACQVMTHAGLIQDGAEKISETESPPRDITEPSQAEMNQRFLNELGRALVALRSPDELMGGIAYRTGRYLQADRCFLSHENLERGQSFIYDDYHPGLFSLSGGVALGDFPPELIGQLAIGRPLIVNDLSQYSEMDPKTRSLLATLHLQAFAAIPLMDREGSWAGTLTVANNKPRTWKADEIELLHSIVDLVRLALENAYLFQDLREFRHRFEVALRNAPIAVFSMDRDLRCTWIFNPGDIFANEEILGQTMETLLMSSDGEPLIGLMKQVLSLGEGLRQEIRVPIQDEYMVLDLTVEPLRDAEDQIVGLTCAAMEVTAQRRMEAEAVSNLAHIEVQHRLIQEREQERTRIARDLHDGPLQDLIATNFTLVEAMDINDKAPRLEKLREIQDSIHRQIDELRRFCNDLRPPVLGSFGLGKTIRAHLSTFQERNPDLIINEDLDSDQRSLPEEVRMTLFRAYQELMNNVIRHAQAKNVTVHFHLEETQAVLEIEDDGIGFDAPLSWVDLAREGHLGLVGLRERVEMTGGHVEIHAARGEGTSIRIVVPRDHYEAEATKRSAQGEIQIE